MPTRWRSRLRHHFWRPQAFRELLESFTAERGRQRSSISPLVDKVTGDAEALVSSELDARKLPLVGDREVSEIATRLAEKAADRKEQPLPRALADQLIAYLAIDSEATSADAKFTAITGGKRFAGARDYYRKRLDEMEELGLNPRRFKFAADFGREIEYYTGFTFQIDAETRDGPVTVAGGGRYDNLLSDMGAPAPIPAVGCAIHTDRLKAVLA